MKTQVTLSVGGFKNRKKLLAIKTLCICRLPLDTTLYLTVGDLKEVQFKLYSEPIFLEEKNALRFSLSLSETMPSRKIEDLEELYDNIIKDSAWEKKTVR